MAQHFDLVVIGAGSGGIAASRRAALHGARVAVVEAGRVGGTCVLRGCVPKKLLMYAAQFGDALRDAAAYGWEPVTAQFEMSRWAAAKAAETARLEGIYRRLLADGGVTLIEGHARLDGPQRVAVHTAAGEQPLTAHHVLVATGAAPVRDGLPGIETCPTSDDLLDLQTLPAAAAIIGSGYIAVEFASLLARLGVTVSMHYRARLPLRGFDGMLREVAAQALADAGVELHPGDAPLRVERLANGWRLELAGGRRRDVPWVLNATGRRPITEGLGLASVGLAADARGAVAVDEHMHTAAAGVHAIGDVTDRLNLTPVAIAQGRALADELFGGATQAADLRLVASAVFMLPPLATLGPSEDEALAAGRRCKVYETEFRPMKQAFIGGRERTHIKLLADADDDRVLALHMAGTDAPEIVQSLAVALAAGATKSDFDRTVAVHPTAAEEFVLLRKPSRTLP